MKQVTIYTDGACAGNPGPGGWAAILECAGIRREVAGAAPATTNNRMELTGAIRGLEALNQRCAVTVFTDSQYLRQGITQWVRLWRLRKWMRGREPVKNQDLWKQLDALTSAHVVQWKWVRGHSGDAQNERCDALATGAMRALMKKLTPGELKAALAEFERERVAPREEASLL